MFCKHNNFTPLPTLARLELVGATIIANNSDKVKLSYYHGFLRGKCEICRLDHHRPGVRAMNIGRVSYSIASRRSISRTFGGVCGSDKDVSVLIGGTNFNVSKTIRFARLTRTGGRFSIGFFNYFVYSGGMVGCVELRNNKEVIGLDSLTTPLTVPFRTFCSTSGTTMGSLALTLTGRIQPFGVGIYTMVPNSIGANFATTERGGATNSRFCNRALGETITNVRHSRRGNVSPSSVTSTICTTTVGTHPGLLSAGNAGCRLFLTLSGTLPISLIGVVIKGLCSWWFKTWDGAIVDYFYPIFLLFGGGAFKNAVRGFMRLVRGVGDGMGDII